MTVIDQALSLLRIPVSPFEPPTLLYHLLTRPLHFSVSHIHHLLNALRGPPIPTPANPIRIVCLSDTHDHTLPIPRGDILIHAGDLTNAGTVPAIQAQLDWLSSLPHAHKIAICGNHDSYFDPGSRAPEDQKRASPALDWKSIRYLQHSATTVELASGRTLHFYGAPQIPACGGREHAFQYARGEDAWTGTVPAHTDVLVTHTPPRWHLDLPWGQGCAHLLGEVGRVRPALHVFGHVHGGRGRELVFWDQAEQSFERVCLRQGLGHLLGVWVWLDALMCLGWGVVGLLWNRVWGAHTDGTLMVNAGVVDWAGKRVVHKPIVVDI